MKWLSVAAFLLLLGGCGGTDAPATPPEATDETGKETPTEETTGNPKAPVRQLGRLDFEKNLKDPHGYLYPPLFSRLGRWGGKLARKPGRHLREGPNGSRRTHLTQRHGR